jgi:hypothetical protein
MTWPSFADILHWLGRYRPRYAVVIAALTAFLLFLPTRALHYFALNDFADHYRAWIALMFGGSALMLLTYPVETAWKWISFKVFCWRSYAKMEEYFGTLGTDELEILARYRESKVNTLLVYDNEIAVAEGLIQKQMLCRMMQREHPRGGLRYSLTNSAIPLVHGPKFQKLFAKHNRDKRNAVPTTR